MSGRVLNFSIVKSDRKTQWNPDITGPVHKLILRKDSQYPANDAVAGFVTSRDVCFELNGRDRRQLIIGFGEFRIEFGLKSLVDYELRELRAEFGHKVVILRLVFQEPPKC